MSMKRLCFICHIVMVYLINSSLASELNVAVIDLEKAVGAAEAVKTINTKLDEEFKTEREELRELRTKLDELEEKQKQNENKMTKERSNKLESELRRRRVQYSNFYGAISEKADSRQEELMEKINPLIKQAIKEVIESNHYDIVYERDKLLHFDPKLDISAKITEKINELADK